MCPNQVPFCMLVQFRNTHCVYCYVALCPSVWKVLWSVPIDQVSVLEFRASISWHDPQSGFAMCFLVMWLQSWVLGIWREDLGFLHCLSCPLILFIGDLCLNCLVLSCLPNLSNLSSLLFFLMFHRICSPSSQVHVMFITLEVQTDIPRLQWLVELTSW